MAKDSFDVKPPRIPSHEEQFQPNGSDLDGWKNSNDPFEGTGGYAYDGKHEVMCGDEDCNAGEDSDGY